MAHLFSQSLAGLIKALRNSKHDEESVIQAALQDINVEVKSTDLDVKAAAVLKLIYLEMLGHPAIITYSFNVLECASSQKFHIKQIGYLAASQSFAASTEVILLANNLIKKDLQTSAHPSTVILALTSLPALLVASPQLAEDLLPDLLRMLSHSKAQVRRIATLTIGKIWCTCYPQSCNLPTIEFSHIEKLRSGLSDDDPFVVSATVNVMLELARSRKDSLQSLLSLAPELFDLLTNSTNNWMLIKIAKLFSLLTPIEPRLVRKLLPPLTNLIAITPAFSLLYECIQTVITGGMLNESDATSPLAQICIEKLSVFLSDKDQNLRYIALKGLSRLLRNAPHTTPLLARHYDDILACINEEDLTIRLKALELVERLTDRSNCKTIVARLIEQISPSSESSSGKTVSNTGLRSAAGALRAVSSAYDTSSPSGVAIQVSSSSPASASSFVLSHYRYRLLLLVLRLTSRSSGDGAQLYVNITNFEWYIDTLVTCAYLSLSVLPTLNFFETTRLAGKLSDCLLDVTARAPSIRPFAVKQCRRLMADHGFISLDNLVATAVTSACAFVMSEYSADQTLEENTQILMGSTALGSTPTGVYLGVMQCLARWLADTAERWQEQQMSSVKGVLDAVYNAMAHAPEEKAALFIELIALVRSGLDGPRLADSGKASHSPTFDDEGLENTNIDLDSNPFASSRPSEGVQERNRIEHGVDITGPPQSLFLLRSIFLGYELRPLAPNAQALVSAPESLDFDAPINVGAVSLSSMVDRRKGGQSGNHEETPDVDEYGRARKATAASVFASASMRSGSSQEDAGFVSQTKRSKKTRTEGASREGKTRKKSVKDTAPVTGDDIDSIPIVKLDLVSNEQGAVDAHDTSVKRGKNTRGDDSVHVTRARTPSPPPIILTAGGEAPRSRPASARPELPVVALQRQPHEGQTGDTPIADTSATVQDSAAVKVVKKKKRKKAKEAQSGDALA